MVVEGRAADVELELVAVTLDEAAAVEEGPPLRVCVIPLETVTVTQVRASPVPLHLTF